MAQKIQVTDEQVLTELRKLVDEFPNRTAQCTYFPEEARVHNDYGMIVPCELLDPENAEGECIVGCLLLGLGVDPLELVKMEGVGAVAVIPELLAGLSQDLVEQLDRLQQIQDGGLNWRDASIASEIFK